MACNSCMTKLVEFYEFQEEIRRTSKNIPEKIKDKSKIETIKNLIENYTKYNEISECFEISLADEILTIKENHDSGNKDECPEEMDCQEEIVEIEDEPVYNTEEEISTEDVGMDYNCGEIFNSEEKYQNPVKSHVKKCPNEKCGREFKSDDEFKKHCKSRCKVPTYPACKVCRKKFNQGNASQYKNHLDQHKSYKYLLEFGYIHVFDCDVCGKVFTTEIERLNHTDEHKESDTELTKMFQCNYCLDQFPSLDEIKEHTIFRHLNYFECPLPNCKIVNSAFRLWYYHFQKSHPGFLKIDTSFPCEYCKMEFDSYYNLERHKKSEDCTGKKFECNHCSKKFGDRNLLVVHMRQVSKVRLATSNQ